VPDDEISRKPTDTRRRWLVASAGFNVLLLLAAGGLGLYAFLLNVDLGDVKRRLSQEVETRQQAERYLIEARNLLTENQREIEQLKAQIAFKESDIQAAASAKPLLPVTVGFRSSMLGRGLVAVIDNTSDRYLTVVLSVRNPTRALAKRFNLELSPRSSTDFGHFEGWQFASGDEVALFNDGFATLRLTVP